ncbi:MAG: hypothetical protein VW226_10365 [Rhodospirillaceae bacterium]
MSYNLVPVHQSTSLPVPYEKIFDPSEDFSERDATEIMLCLPEVLGRVLATCWLNPRVLKYLELHGHVGLQNLGLKLPSSISVEFSTSSTNRPQVTVYEAGADPKYHANLFDLKLALMATS